MHLKWIGRMAIILGLFLTVAVSAKAAGKDDPPPYTIINGKVDFGTYNGYRRYHNSCHRCHGPDAIGCGVKLILIHEVLRAQNLDSSVAEFILVS